MMMQNCTICREDGYMEICLAQDAAERAYVMLDALMTGRLHSFAFRSEGDMLQCLLGGQDMLSKDVMVLTEQSAEALKTTLFGVVQDPRAAAWLHADMQMPGVDIVVRFCLNG